MIVLWDHRDTLCPLLLWHRMAVTDPQPAHGTIRNSSDTSNALVHVLYCVDTQGYYNCTNRWTHTHPHPHTTTPTHTPSTHIHTHARTHSHVHSDIHSLTHTYTLILTICRYGTGIEPVRPSSCLANHHSSSSLRSTVILSPFLKLRSSGSSCHTTHTAERVVTAAVPSSFTVTVVRSRRQPGTCTPV